MEKTYTFTDCDLAFFAGTAAWICGSCSRHRSFSVMDRLRTIEFKRIFSKKDDENDIDLTREAIEFAVRNRLQGAHLYTDEPGFPHLFVSVDVVGLAFGIDIGLKKLVSDFYSKDAWFVATWSTGTTGIHGWEGNYILQFVSQYTDSFIDEYLRVNADSC